MCAPTIFRSPSLRGTMTSGDSLANERESFRMRQAAQTWGSLPSLPYETDSCTYVWTYIHTYTYAYNKYIHRAVPSCAGADELTWNACSLPAYFGPRPNQSCTILTSIDPILSNKPGQFLCNYHYLESYPSLLSLHTSLWSAWMRKVENQPQFFQ